MKARAWLFSCRHQYGGFVIAIFMWFAYINISFDSEFVMDGQLKKLSLLSCLLAMITLNKHVLIFELMPLLSDKYNDD